MFTDHYKHTTEKNIFFFFLCNLYFLGEYFCVNYVLHVQNNKTQILVLLNKLKFIQINYFLLLGSYNKLKKM